MSYTRLNADQQLNDLQEMLALSSAFHASLDLDTVAQTIVDRVFCVASVHAVALYCCLHDSGVYDVVAFAPESSADLSAHLFATQAGVLCDVLSNLQRVTLTVTDHNGSARSVWLVPLHVHQELVGLLALWEYEHNLLTEREQDIIKTISGQASLALRNALTHTRIDDTLRERVIAATLDRNAIADDVLAAIISTIGAETGHCLLPNAAGDLEVIARFDTSETRLSLACELNPSSALITQVVQTQEPVLVADSWLNEAKNGLTPGRRSALCVPILSDDQLAGILLFEDSTPNAFTDSHVRFVTMLTKRAAVAIEHARLYQAVRAGRDQLQAIVDSTCDAVLLFDHHGRLLRFNPVAEDMLAEPLSSFLGQSFLSWLRTVRAKRLQELVGLSLLQFRQYVLDLLRNPTRVTHRQFQQVHGDTIRYIIETGSPVLDQEGQPAGWLIVWRDNTEECKLDTIRRELSSMVVHDLRNPITSIISGMGMLQNIMATDKPDPQVVSEVIQITQNSAQNMLNLVQSLLEVAWLEQSNVTLDCESLSLLDSIDYAITSMLGLAVSADIAIKTNAPNNLPAVWVDDGKIRRVLVNLLDNALRHTPHEGVIQIDVQYQPGENVVMVRVEDTGPGIPPDERQRIFDKFVQLDCQSALRGHKGTGLGLTFCRLAIEAHGGAIWAEEGTMGGAAFCFTVPVVSTHGSWLESGATQ